MASHEHFSLIQGPLNRRSFLNLADKASRSWVVVNVFPANRPMALDIIRFFRLCQQLSTFLRLKEEK
jgi:hypothetical protein